MSTPDDRPARPSIFESFAAAQGAAGVEPSQPPPAQAPPPVAAKLVRAVLIFVGSVGLGLVLASAVYKIRDVDVNGAWRIVGFALIAAAAIARSKLSTEGSKTWSFAAGVLGFAVGALAFLAGSGMPAADQVALDRVELPGFTIELPAGTAVPLHPHVADDRIERTLRVGGRRVTLTTGWDRRIGADVDAETMQSLFSGIGGAGQVREETLAGHHGYSVKLNSRDGLPGWLFGVVCTGSDLTVYVGVGVKGEAGFARDLARRMADSVECQASGALPDAARPIPHIALPDSFGTLVEEDGMTMLVSWNDEVLRFESIRTDLPRLPVELLRGMAAATATQGGAELRAGPTDRGSHRNRAGVELHVVHATLSGTEESLEWFAASFTCPLDKTSFVGLYLTPEGQGTLEGMLEVLAEVGCPRDDSPTLDELPAFADVAGAACQAGNAAACAALEPGPGGR